MSILFNCSYCVMNSFPKCILTILLSILFYPLLAQVDPKTNKKDENELEPPSVSEEIQKAPDLKTVIKIFLQEESVIKDINSINTETRLRKKSRKKGRGIVPVAKNYKVRLQITNNNAHPMWYLMPFKGENKLPASGIFEASDSLDSMLRLLEYKGLEPDTYLRELQFTGKSGSHFRAFYIPAKGTMLLSNFTVDCWQDSEMVEFWAVKDLKINNQDDFNKVLPYNFLSSSNAQIYCSSDKGCSPKLIEPEMIGNSIKINFVRANKVSKYKVKLSR